MIGRQMGPRDVEVRGWLALLDLPDEVQRAEDATAAADNERWTTGIGVITKWLHGEGQVFDRPATDTERLLLAGLGYTLPDDLTTRVHYRNVLRHRSWPQLEEGETHV